MSTIPDRSPATPRSRALRRRQASLKRPPGLSGRAGTFVVRVDLAYAASPLWRRLELASDLRLDEVHAVVQAAFDWDGGHLHDFRTYGGTGQAPGRTFAPTEQIEAGDGTQPEHKVTLNQVLRIEGDQLEYTYDFGDSWLHVLTLETVTEATDGAPRARVVTGERAAPPDDCGGIGGYEDLCEVLVAPDHPDHDHLAEWFEEMTGIAAQDFAPDVLDIEALDERVRRAARPAPRAIR